MQLIAPDHIAPLVHHRAAEQPLPNKPNGAAFVAGHNHSHNLGGCPGLSRQYYTSCGSGVRVRAFEPYGGLTAPTPCRCPHGGVRVIVLNYTAQHFRPPPAPAVHRQLMTSVTPGNSPHTGSSHKDSRRQRRVAVCATASSRLRRRE
jgi:hypothetical protein